MLCRRAKHLSAQKQAAADLGIDSQYSLVAQHDPAASLVLEGHKSGCKAILEVLVQLVQVEAHRCHLRICKDDRQRRATQAGAYIGITAGIVASDATLIGRFVQ